MPEPREHMDSRGWIETVLRKIPGFRGYLEKEYRRESDELQRNWLADRLQRAKRAFDEYGRTLVDNAQLDALPQLERVRARLNKLIARIAGAMQGYSGMFDLVQINEAVLDQVYEYDVQLMNQVEALAEGFEKLTASNDTPSALMNHLAQQIEAIETAWDKREDILKGLK